MQTSVVSYFIQLVTKCVQCPMNGELCASNHVTQIPIAASLRRRRPLQQARRRGPGVLPVIICYQCLVTN